ncbi:MULTISPECIES: DUF4262 domain-containing protein [unclassified Xanthomonas]|uniref:DUF4262 domain-containing protein n=1 Tax=unclassified Xanthomonas TaxID=2643310 RepID=UPI001D053E9A|nr:MULTISPECIES: DUF4262 domain-containing protein [unclassified Xanthomonas]
MPLGALLSNASTDMNRMEQRILNNVEKFGCHITSVFDPSQIQQPFSYSIGLAKTLGIPEVIVVGVRSDLGSALINRYMERARNGELFVAGLPYTGFLEGFPVQFRQVLEVHRETYMLSATWFHGGTDYAALQIVYPTLGGVWPWDPDASDDVRQSQPLLDGAGISI